MRLFYDNMDECMRHILESNACIERLVENPGAVGVSVEAIAVSGVLYPDQAN